MTRLLGLPLHEGRRLWRPGWALLLHPQLVQQVATQNRLPSLLPNTDVQLVIYWLLLTVLGSSRAVRPGLPPAEGWGVDLMGRGGRLCRGNPEGVPLARVDDARTVQLSTGAWLKPWLNKGLKTVSKAQLEANVPLAQWFTEFAAGSKVNSLTAQRSKFRGSSVNSMRFKGQHRESPIEAQRSIPSGADFCALQRVFPPLQQEKLVGFWMNSGF